MNDDESPNAIASDVKDYEEPGGGNYFLGFMFGNVDDSGDLDADYLDEDVKEHMFALADELGLDLQDIDLVRSSPAPTDSSEQDYDEKAEDTVDFEDIDEEYDGFEVEEPTEEDNVLSRKDYFSSNAVYTSVNSTLSVFDEDNYDEDEETTNDIDSQVNSAVQNCSSDVLIEQPVVEPSDVNLATGNVGLLPHSEECLDLEYETLQREMGTDEGYLGSETAASLPVLCIEDGNVILRFCEIFGGEVPARKRKADHHTHPMNKELQIAKYANIVEEDEEILFRSSIQNISNSKHIQIDADFVESDSAESVFDVSLCPKDSCISEQPMKDSLKDIPSAQRSPVCPDFYPLEHDDWENYIIWDNSPAAESQPCLKGCAICEESMDTHNGDQATDYGHVPQCCVVNGKINGHVSPVITNPFGFIEMPAAANHNAPEKKYHSLTKETSQNNNVLYPTQPVTMQQLNNLCLMNRELLDGSWWDYIIWDPSVDTPKPKLIFDLKDDHMLFETVDGKEVDHIHSHPPTIIAVSPSMKNSSASPADNFGNQPISLGDHQFNISNDKFYCNKKAKLLQQAKFLTKKGASMCIKVVHSAPAQKLQTMKPKLSNKEIASFHRPKAKWYPHENKVACQLHGTAVSHGRITVIVMTLGGKGIKLMVNADKTPVSVKLKISKKLAFKHSESIKLFYSGKELQDDISLAMQNVRPNSILHSVCTKVNLWPKAHMLPGEGKPLHPPGAFRKKVDLSVKDGHVFLMEYCEESPLLLSNTGMGARLCTYYRKTSCTDETATSLQNNSDGMGTVFALDPADISPFLGQIRSGSHQSCLETNMYRSPIFPHLVSSRDYLLVRSAKGALFLRRIDKVYAVGQEEPHMEVFSPGTKNLQNYLLNRMLVYVYREFRARESPGIICQIRADELPIQSPLTDAIVRKRLKHCAELKKGPKGHFWMKRPDFHVPSEEELKRLLAPESVCCYESMQAGLYRLKQLGIVNLTHPVGLASAMNQLPDEAIELAAAAHIERELQITSWNLTSNFVACTNQDRKNIERLEITGFGDPSGVGLGFSYVKKKSAVAKGTTVTGTDADLRRLSNDAARQLLLKFGIPEAEVHNLTRWDLITMVRKLSSEKAALGTTIDEIPVSKFARRQNMSSLQSQQQTREECQEVWDRQLESLSAIDVDNESDTEANNDLDSFAGDLENLLDSEEFDDEDTRTAGLVNDKAEGMTALQMRRCLTRIQINGEIEDDEAEASLAKKLLEGNGKKRRKQPVEMTNYETSVYDLGGTKSKQSETGKMIRMPGHTATLTSKGSTPREVKEFGHMRTNMCPKYGEDQENTEMVTNSVEFNPLDQASQTLSKKLITTVSFEDTETKGPGHMRTNKLCPKYGEDQYKTEMDTNSVQFNPLDQASQTLSKKLITTVSFEDTETKGPEQVEKTKSVPVKFKCPERSLEQNMSPSGSLVSVEGVVDVIDFRPTRKADNILKSNEMRFDDYPPDILKASVVFRPPAEFGKNIPSNKITVKQPKGLLDQQRHVQFRTVQEPTRKNVELSDPENKIKEDWSDRQACQMSSLSTFKGERHMQEHMLIESGIHEKREEGLQRIKNKIKGKREPEIREEVLLYRRPYKDERHWTSKRRRGGEVELSNILEKVVDCLRRNTAVSYIFLKPVTKKDAPDYLSIIDHPMDLGTIRDKVRNMEYRNRKEFRHDVAQIAVNAHIYNDNRNPGIPPLADELLKMCDQLLEQNAEMLDDAEGAIQ